MRVLHVHSGNIYGGIEAMLMTLTRYSHLCPDMETQYALCFDGRFGEELERASARVHKLGNVRLRNPSSILKSRRALKRLLAEERFDAIICHSAWSIVVFGPTIRSEGTPLVFWLHGAANGQYWLERWARKTQPDFAICNSQFTASTLTNLYPGIRSEVVYCPVTFHGLSYPQSELSAARAELNTGDEDVVITQVSRMEEGKGHALHLEALSRLRDLPGWVCWMIGGAQRSSEIQYFNNVKAIADKLEIFDRIRFAGQRNDVAKLLAASDIHCQPNTGPEGFGITFIEGLEARLPVITTAIGAAKEIVDDSCGMLVPPDDALAIARALRQLIEDSGLRENLGNAGPSRARLICDPPKQIQQLHKILAGLQRSV